MKSWLGRFLIGLAVLSTASAAHATTWHVENNGTDSSTCGATVDPCRTIGQAITNAAAGDTVVVGPGLYGNLGYDFTEVGEEPPCSDAGSILCVDKRLTIESSNGAERTRLNAGSLRSGVRLSADGSIFGRVGRGFTNWLGAPPL